MDFVAPLMLLGAAGAAIPIAIHLIGRRRARRVRFAALDFLLGSDRKLARSLRLRELALLALRVLVCLAIPLILAKPYAGCRESGPLVTRGPQAAVIVVDDSFGAGYHLGGETLIDRSKREARKILDQLGPEAEVAVVTSSAGGRAPTELSRDHIRLRDYIKLIEATARPPDTTAALGRAYRLLAGSNHQNRTIYLISPLAAVGVRPDEAPWPDGKGPTLYLVDPSNHAALDNSAITAVTVEADPEAGPRGIRVTADVLYQPSAPGPAAPVERPIALRIAGAVVARGTVELHPGKDEQKRFAATLPPGARVADITVELAADALPIDDRRYALAVLRDEIPVLLVDGDPRTVHHEDELFYLSAALRPGDRDDSGAVLTSATADDLGKLDLDDYDVIVLANLHALPAASASRLAAWVHGGGGLFVSLGGNVDPDAYGATMSGLLPQALASAIDTGFGHSAGERAGRALHLAKLELEHPVFAPFATSQSGLADARFTKVMLLGPTTDVLGRKVLARYDNGAVALVEAEAGDGRVLLYTSTIDREWTDLPIQPGFVPMMQGIIRYLAKKPSAERRRELVVGGQAMIDVPTGAQRLDVIAPGKKRSVFEGETLADRKQVRFTATRRPGFYRVVAVDGEGGEAPRDEASFAVNLDPRGSDLRPASADALPNGGGGGPAGEHSHERRLELWHAVAAALLVLLLAESILLARS
jgi:hypothetical protein